MIKRLMVTALFVLSMSALADNGQNGDANSEQLPDSLTSKSSEPGVMPGSNLEIIEQDRYGEILTARNVDWNVYSKIQLERATVAFRENWVRDQRQRHGNIIKEKDQQRIKSNMADLLEEVLIRELFVRGGYTMTYQSGADVMRVVPRIVKLDVFAPDGARNYTGHVLVDRKARMTLELEIYDSVSGKLLATTRQHQEDIRDYMEQADRGTNRTAARFMMLRWTDWLRDWLNQARSGES